MLGIFWVYMWLCTQGFTGLDMLGQRSIAEYVLAAFSATAGAASGEELCRLGRGILLTGAIQKALWDAFADATAAALQRQRQNEFGQRQGSMHQQTEAELIRWLRFCGRVS